MMSDYNKKAIVIGAGIAGIAAAIRLRVQGYNVEVYDKNQGPGGKITVFKLGDYQFDAGPSLFTQPENIQELFELAGEPMEDFFQYTSLPISFKYFYPDGSIVNAYTDNLKFANEMEHQLGEKKEKVLSYLANAKKLYQHIAGLFLEHSLHRYQTFFSFRIFKAIATLRWKYIQRSMHDLNSRHFRKAKTVQLFDRFATYNGSNPYQAPGMLSLIPHLELNQGTFYPKGGMISITNALYQLALKKGVQFHFLSKVEKILLQDEKAIGIQIQSEKKPADLVISNVDVYFTYLKLLDQASMAQKVLKQERSSSACIFYWGINRNFPQLELHNIFFAENYQQEFESIFKTGLPHADPTIYINITSKMEPGIQAASGKENWFVMVNVSANTGQDWNTTKAFYRAAIIAKLNKLLKVDLETCIEVEETLDPETIEQKTDSYMGSLYGTSSNSKQAAFLRHPNFSTTIKNLYFVGGSVHPGGGIPLCLKSAAIMSRLVAEKHSTIHERKLA